MAVTGGTERMITEKANYLSERYGYDVTIITCFQLSKEENIFPKMEYSLYQSLEELCRLDKYFRQFDEIKELVKKKKEEE